METAFDINLYLARISYAGDLAPTIENLFKLQKTHLKNVPFENLDIHNKKQFDFKDSFDKIVIQNRGGFCYELNFLFYKLLIKTGYNAKLISARVFDKEKGYGEEFDHMAIIVTLNEDEFLVDVGFGEFSFYPLKIELNKETADPRGVFRITKFEKDYLSVEKKDENGVFVPEYIFTKNERQPDEFNDMCSYHQTSSKSHFTQKRLCSLPTDDGRITLSGDVLKISTNGITTEKEIKNESEADQVLWDYFRIKIDNV